ncbi:hypothetical protein [Ideonella sp.]
MRMRRATARQCLVAVAVLVGWWWHSYADAAPSRSAAGNARSAPRR